MKKLNANSNLVLPCLLDRLTDRYPKAKREGGQYTLIGTKQYKESILRDLSFLLNSYARIQDYELEGSGYPERSVLAYGVESLSGVFVSDEKGEELEKNIKESILQFEPRIDGGSLEVKLLGKSDTNDGAVIELLISGNLLPLSVNESLYIKTAIDPESGKCTIRNA